MPMAVGPKSYLDDIADIPLGIRESPLGPPFVVTSGRGIYEEAILLSGSADAAKQ
jgi:hypothetical protein